MAYEAIPVERIGLYELSINTKTAPTEFKGFLFKIFFGQDTGEKVNGHKIFCLDKRKHNTFVRLLKKYYCYDEKHHMTGKRQIKLHQAFIF